MKKYVMAVSMLALMAALVQQGAFALDITAGLMANIMNGTRNSYFDYDDVEYRENGGGFGLYGSAGWKYADFNLVFFGYIADMTDFSNLNFGRFSSAVFQFGVYGKFPFSVAPKLRIFPTVGADFAVGKNYSDLGGIGLYMGGGIGADFMLFGNMFLRATILAGYDIFKHGFGMVFKAGMGWLL